MSGRKDITIARVIARLNVGGPAIQTILMTAILRERGYRTLLIAGKVAPGEASMEYLAEAHGVKVVRVPAMSRSISPYHDLLSLLQLVRLLRRYRPMIVHTHTAKAGTLGRVAAMMLRVPIRVHTFHGNVFQGYFSSFVTRVFLGIERFLARHTDCIVAVSESQKRELSEDYRLAPPQKIVAIPLGFDLDPFLGLQVEKHSSLNHDPPVVGWIGRLTTIKNPGMFLECIRLLNHSVPSTRFVMVGDGELRRECEEKIRRERLEDLVALLGWRQNLQQIYANLNLVVSTSINEGTPVALLETMASARAIVSTAVGGVRDLMVGRARNLEGMEVFDNGILVKPDAGLVARAIRYLLERPEQRQMMGQAGRAFVRERFSQTRLADDLERLYISLAHAKGFLPASESNLIRGSTSPA